jgi:hypothetical protein
VYLKHTLFLASIRTKHKMLRIADSAARCPENDGQPTHGEQEQEDQLTQEQFDNELKKDVAVMLTQEELDEEQGGAEGREGEATEGKEQEDDDDEGLEEGYESLEDPFPREPRQRPTVDELDMDFDPNEKVGIRP